VSRALKVGKRAFFVTSTKSTASLPLCQPEGEGTPPEPEELGPKCHGQPPLTAITVIGYGPAKPSGLELMVSTGVTGQQGDVSLSHVIYLVKDILSGKIH
jgi:hypothetical protein